LLTHHLPFCDLPTHTEIADFYISLSVQQYVVQLDISVRDLFCMDVAQAIDNLFEDLLSIRFFKPTSLSHVIEQVSACTQLHYDDYMLLSLYSFIDLNHMIVPEFQE
jgi:hypothetical protein